jgi:hypothetical protein
MLVAFYPEIYHTTQICPTAPTGVPFLHAPQVAIYPQGWYNTSSDDQINSEGIPYGFAPRSVPGRNFWYALPP